MDPFDAVLALDTTLHAAGRNAGVSAGAAAGYAEAYQFGLVSAWEIDGHAHQPAMARHARNVQGSAMAHSGHLCGLSRSWYH
jgi:hypothetical protein